MLPTKFWFLWPSGFRGEDFLINSCVKSAWYARRQHSYNICKDFLSHNSRMKNLNLPKSIQTIRLSIPITVWSELAKGFSIYSTSYEKSPTIWWIKSNNFGMKNWNITKKYTDHKTINSNNYAKFEVNWPNGSQFTVWHTKNRLQFDV